jgi:sensor histidine kinase YesM
VFGVLERWPRQLPQSMARWVLQVVGVAVTIPFVMYWHYVWSARDLALPFWRNLERLQGFLALSMSGLLVGPWMALSALIRQKVAFAEDLALAFELERSEMARQALDARLKLLQSQVEPHFLFNTLANVRELVDSGSPQASAVLDNLIAYLRAAVPRLHEPSSSIAEELQLVRAYLEIMHLRMPDRLRFTIANEDAALAVRCPPMTLLTLVENAVRHGIDPSEEGGEIRVQIAVQQDRCTAQVSDTGVGMQAAGAGLGTGLATLRERLQLTFSGAATLQISSVLPHGVCVTLNFPARRVES